MINTCLHCGNKWETNRRAKFCSSTCNHLYKYHQSRSKIDFTTICQQCGKQFTSQRLKVQYCSKGCNNLALQTKKYYNDVQFKLTKNLRNRLYKAIKNNQKAGSAVDDLGCTVAEFKTYIESLWQDDMSWDNWTTDGWHIDHIVPINRFDLTNPEELKKACHYTNLQPLWAKDNLRKEK